MARKGADPNWRSKEILPEGWIDQAGLCSDCRKAPPRYGQSYCIDCHNRRAREWRKTHALTGEARDKANSRSYAGVYKRRGHLIPQPCKCGATETQMHHPDYSKPLEVEWMCRNCHLAWHALEAAISP
jgi:hypothetical protein